MRKQIFITGAGRGIGLGLTESLLKRGHTLWATTRTPTDELKSLTHKYKDTCFVKQLDVAEERAIDGLSEWLPKNLVLDMVINNAGVFQEDGSFEKVSLKNILSSFQVNTLGPLLVTQKLLPNLLRSSSPKIFHITSQMGSISDNKSGGYYSYRMSKAALNMFNKSFSVDFPGVTSVVLHPGWVRTRMGGAGASVSVEDSVAGLLKVIEGVGPKDSGRFFNFKGEPIGW